MDVQFKHRSRFWLRVAFTESCWLWMRGKNKAGYGKFRVGPRTDTAHRVSWVIAHGAIPPRMNVCHRCDTPACVRPDHLFLGTTQDNVADRCKKGRSGGAPRGEGHHNNLLTEEQAREAKYGTESAHKLAAKFGVSPWTIYSIRQQKTWAHL